MAGVFDWLDTPGWAQRLMAPYNRQLTGASR
jgi:hypothetical protein